MEIWAKAAKVPDCGKLEPILIVSSVTPWVKSPFTVVDVEVLGGLVAGALGGGLVLLVTAGVLAATPARGGDQGQDRQQRDERA